jgi:hypothetical protein
MHVLLRVGHLEEEHLRDDDVRHHVIDRRAQEYDAIDQ